MKMRKWHSTVQQKVCQHQASAGQEFLTTETRGPTREGSCPGPIIFTIYTSEPFHIAEKHLPSVLAMLTIRSCMWRSARSNVPGDDDIASLRTYRTLCRPASGWPYISLLISTFLNHCISVKTSLINIKLGDFVNLGVLFLTMWINSC